jgi:hypothetical protein
VDRESRVKRCKNDRHDLGPEWEEWRRPNGARCPFCWREMNSRYETSDKGRARKDAWLDVFENRVKAQFSKDRYRWRTARERRHARYEEELGTPFRPVQSPFARLTPRLLGRLRVQPRATGRTPHAYLTRTTGRTYDGADKQTGGHRANGPAPDTEV